MCPLDLRKTLVMFCAKVPDFCDVFLSCLETHAHFFHIASRFSLINVSEYFMQIPLGIPTMQFIPNGSSRHPHGNIKKVLVDIISVCDDTQNLNETESETFFRYQIFPIPNPILFPIPNIFDTESDTFFVTKFFRYRIRNHQKNGKVSKPRSFETETSPKIPKI